MKETQVEAHHEASRVVEALPPMRVAILLSTYNGERYLAEQLESLLAQDYPALEVFVRDDGSSDGTRAILERFAAMDARICLTIATVHCSESSARTTPAAAPQPSHVLVAGRPTFPAPTAPASATAPAATIQ